MAQQEEKQATWVFLQTSVTSLPASARTRHSLELLISVGTPNYLTKEEKRL